MALLQELVGQADEGRGHVALVSGEAGIGKTRLVDELRRSLRDKSAWCARATAFPDDRAIAFGPLAESLRASRRIHPAFWEAAGARSDLLAAIAPELGRESALGTAAGHADLPVLFEALLDAVEEASLDGPCVWVLEDLHWADASTWEFVKHAARRVSELPLLLIATFREDEVGLANGWWQRLASAGGPGEVEALRLARLTDQDAFVLAATLAPELSSQAMHDVVRRSAGTPLLIEALVALPSPDSEQLARVPEIVELTFRDHVAHLSVPARELVDVVAVAGSDASCDLLLKLDQWGLDESLAECESCGLLRRDDAGEVSFRHPLLLEAAYRAVAPARQAGLHGQVGHLLAEQGDGVAERVARHLERANRPSEALEVLETGAGQAREAGNVGRAASLLEVALHLLRRHPGLGRSEEEIAMTAIADLFRAGRWTDLDPLVRSRWAQRHGLEPAERAWLASVFALHLFWTGSISEADTVAQQELAHLDQAGQVDHGAMLLAQAAFIAWFRGDGERSVTLGRRALAIASEAGDPEAECRAINAITQGAFQLDHDRMAAVESHRDNARRARTHGLGVAEANALWSASHFLVTTEAYEAAEGAAERAGTWYVALARVWKGMVHLVEGRPDEAEAIFAQLGSQIRNGGPALAPWMDTVEAWLFLHRGDLEEARRLLGGPAARSEAADLVVWVDQRSAAEGWLAWEDGRWVDAADHLARAADECKRCGYHLTVGGPILLPIHVDALLRLRRRGDAEDLIETVRRDHPAPDRFFDASVAAAMFRLRPTLPAAGDALVSAEQAPWPWLAALVLSWQAELLRDRRAAVAAQQRFERLGAHARARHAEGLHQTLNGRAPSKRSATAGLSARELEVAQLIASGLTNPAIGRRLHLSRPTVASHVSHILTKLGFSSRSQVAAWIADREAAGGGLKSSI